MRLIDADALTNDILRRWNTNDDTDFANKEVWKALEEAQTIDAVPVVRCKDCLWYAPFDDCKPYACEFSGMSPVDGNDFCSVGERKDND